MDRGGPTRSSLLRAPTCECFHVSQEPFGRAVAGLAGCWLRHMCWLGCRQPSGSCKGSSEALSRCACACALVALYWFETREMRQYTRSGMRRAQACCMCTVQVQLSKAVWPLADGVTSEWGAVQGLQRVAPRSDPAPLACRSSCWTRRETCAGGAAGRPGWRMSSGTASWMRGGT